MRTCRRGFSLVELVGVISIILMLTGIFFVLPGGQYDAAIRVGAGISTLSTQMAEAAYVRRHGATAPAESALRSADLVCPATRTLKKGDCCDPEHEHLRWGSFDEPCCPHAPEVLR